MQDFSIHDVRFRRTCENRSRILVYGQVVGDVVREPDTDNPHEPFSYRIDLYDGAERPCTVRRRSQIRLAIADWLWNDKIVPPRIDAATRPSPRPAAHAA